MIQNKGIFWVWHPGILLINFSNLLNQFLMNFVLMHLHQGPKAHSVYYFNNEGLLTILFLQTDNILK